MHCVDFVCCAIRHLQTCVCQTEVQVRVGRFVSGLVRRVDFNLVSYSVVLFPLSQICSSSVIRVVAILFVSST